MSLNISPKDSAVIKEMDAGVGRVLTSEPWEQSLPWGTLLWHKVHPFQLCLLTVFKVISEQVLRMFTNSFFSQSGGSLCHGKICAHGPWVGPAFTYLCWNTGWGRYPGVSESFVASMRSVCVCVCVYCVCVCVCVCVCWEHTSTQAANCITSFQPVPPPLPCVLTHTHKLTCTHRHRYIWAHIDTHTYRQMHMCRHVHRDIYTNAHIYTYMFVHRHTHRYTHMQSHTHACTHRDTHTYGHTETRI